jgi:hypothetical protein
MTPTRTTTGRSQIGQMWVFATRGVYVRVWPCLMRASNPFHHSEWARDGNRWAGNAVEMGWGGS